jgi:translation initiation factor IF-2
MGVGFWGGQEGSKTVKYVKNDYQDMNKERQQKMHELLKRGLKLAADGEEMPAEWARELFPPERREYELGYYKNKKEAEAARQVVQSEKPKAAAEAREEDSEKYYMSVIVRADAAGSLEAILSEIARLGDEHSKITIVQSGIGNISESDMKTALAGSQKAVVIGFNVGIDAIAETIGNQQNVRVEKFNIIYKLTEFLEELLQTSRPKRTVEEVIGKARVLRVFSSRKAEHVVGGTVFEGFLEKKGDIRVIRRNVTVIGEGKLLNMQASKINVDRVEKGTEFGTQIEAPFEIAEGDILLCFRRTTV